MCAMTHRMLHMYECVSVCEYRFTPEYYTERGRLSVYRDLSE